MEEQNQQASPAQESLQEPENTRQPGRILGTSVVACVFVILLLAIAALVFLLIASVVQGEWLMAGVYAFVVIVILFIMNRLVRVAANQNKLT